METSLAPVEFPELFIGIAGPVGVDIELITNTISDCLRQLKYDSQPIRLTSEMMRFSKRKTEKSDADHFSILNMKMDNANEIRADLGLPDALARVAVQTIREYRKSFTGEVRKPKPSQAYLIRQLKLPEEVHLLRRVYGRQFILISAYASESDRVKLLEKIIKKDLPTDTQDTDIEHKASLLISRDAKEDNKALGQNLRETFHLADVFIHGIDKGAMEQTLNRFFDAFFGRVDITPSIEEFGMYQAKSAALRSADLSRQVGAGIFSHLGDIITQGCNEVPKVKGGNYWDQDEPDYRDVKMGHDPNDALKKEVLRNVIERLEKGGMLSEKALKFGNSFGILKALTDKKDITNGILSDAYIMDLTEYGRVVHAEMNALCDAARIGKSVKDATRFVTTFPCHNCTKHIIAAGIKKVVFLEPYPKSKALELFENEIEIESEENDDKVSFLPFLGVSPFRYRDIFQKGRRKGSDGISLKWYFGAPKPMIETEFPSYSSTTEPWAIAPLFGNLMVSSSDSKNVNLGSEKL